MSIFAIGDLHLSNSVDKPMDIFGSEWTDHAEKIKKNWTGIVDIDDTVLIVGDISWALKMDEAGADLNWISSLPGKKILIKGNHDLWWSSIGKLRATYQDLFFIQNNHAVAESYAICGSRGWLCPGDEDFTEADNKIYKRELLRIRTSLESAKNSGYDKIIGAIHYPPTNNRRQSSGFTDLFEEFGVGKVVYGHLHGQKAYGTGLQGDFKGISYHLTSADYLSFVPKKIL